MQQHRLRQLRLQRVEREVGHRSEVRAGQLWCTRLDGVSMVRETGWVYRSGERAPRVVQEMMATLTRIPSTDVTDAFDPR